MVFFAFDVFFIRLHKGHMKPSDRVSPANAFPGKALASTAVMSDGLIPAAQPAGFSIVLFAFFIVVMVKPIHEFQINVFRYQPPHRSAEARHFFN